MARVSVRVRKNLLDLEYMTALQHVTTAWIVLLTYAVGVGIALITQQVDVRDNGQVLLLVAFSVLVGVLAGRFVLVFQERMALARQKIRSLKRL